MNSLSQKEISSQLFYLSRESVKTIVLNSKCGLLAQVRVSKKSSSINDISILNNFSPLICIYRKSSPMFIHSKSSRGFDESTFRKEINPSTNAFMSLCLLELSEYYSHYSDENRNICSFDTAFKYLANEQLKFYSENLRNAEGLFVNKKNISDGNSKGFLLVDKDDKFRFSDQAFMMDAYYLYSIYNNSDENSSEYERFSFEILSMFRDYKDSLYDLSFDENLKIFLALNIMYEYSKNNTCKNLILDLGDFLINKFQEKDYYIDSLDDCALFAICCLNAYKHTGILSFKEFAKDINEKLINLYDSDKNLFLKLTDKKDSKYSCTEITLYLLSIMLYSCEADKITELKPVVSGVYRKFFVNNPLLTCWPEAPTLDEVERYRKLSLRSDDMLDETYFRMPVLPTPKTTGLAPVFIKSLTYSKKKDTLSASKNSFDSNRNMFNFFMLIHFLKDDVEDFMGFSQSSLESNNLRESISDNTNIDNTDKDNGTPLKEEPRNNTENNIPSDENLNDKNLDDSDINIELIPDFNHSSLPDKNEYVDLKGTKKDINMNLSTLSNNKTILSPKLSITNNNLKSSFKNSKKIKPSRKKSK